MNYGEIVDEMRMHADEPGRTHLLQLKESLTLAAPELIPHLFWERIPSICNYFFHDNNNIRAVFQKAAEWEMNKQKMGI